MVIRMRHTSSHTKNRRSHHALKGERVSKEKDSGVVHPRHKALLDGTLYRGRSVMDLTSKKAVAKKAVAQDKKQDDKKTEEVVPKLDDQGSTKATLSKKPTEKKIKK